MIAACMGYFCESLASVSIEPAMIEINSQSGPPNALSEWDLISVFHVLGLRGQGHQ